MFISNFFRNVSIGKKLWVSFGAISLIVVVLGIFPFHASLSTGESISKVKEEIYPDTMGFIDLKFHIIQIQQWLTDISATRAAQGYDDGFDEAQSHYQAAKFILQQKQVQHRQRGESRVVQTLAEAEQNLDAYYETGKKMAQAYIDGGPGAGNQMMESFDTTAEQMTQVMESLVAEHRAELETSFDTVIANGRSTQRELFLLIAVVALISGTTGFFITRDIKKRVDQIKQAFGRAARGDLTAHLNSSHRDELGMISSSYDALIRRLNGLVGGMGETVSALNTASTELEKVSGTMRKESEYTSERANTVAAATEEMNVNMSSVAASTEQTTTNIQTIVSATAQMDATIQGISENTTRGNSITRAAVDQAQKVSSQIDHLNAAAAGISKVTDAISEISEQTNLLALNATIEAARAGEAGKGFAVVASEIKALAQQTSHATDDINERVSGIQSITQNSIEAIQSIVSVINDINEIVSTVATAVDEQLGTTQDISRNVSQAATGVVEVNSNISQISSVTAEVSESLSQVSHSARETDTGSRAIHDRSVELSGMAGSLGQLIKEFKVA